MKTDRSERPGVSNVVRRDVHVQGHQFSGQGANLVDVQTPKFDKFCHGEEKTAC